MVMLWGNDFEQIEQWQTCEDASNVEDIKVSGDSE
jgi:hypothetical protein